MKIRADLRVNGGERRLLLVSGPNELDARLANKLAAALLFWDDEPIFDAGAKIPALADFEFLPDALGLDAEGGVKLWVECSTTTVHKLTKITRRAPRARVIVLKETERDAQRLRSELDSGFDRPERVEVLAWPGDSFKAWRAAVGETTEVYGEAGGLSINAVVNGVPFAVDLRRLAAPAP